MIPCSMCKHPGGFVQFLIWTVRHEIDIIHNLFIEFTPMKINIIVTFNDDLVGNCIGNPLGKCPIFFPGLYPVQVFLVHRIVIWNQSFETGNICYMHKHHRS